MSKQDISEEERRDHLHEQMIWLVESMKLFDDGREAEAKRLAHTLRTLVHDTRNSHSLLGQLGIKEQFAYWSVLPDFGSSPNAVYTGVGMRIQVINGAFSSRYNANLVAPKQKLAFAPWWENDIVIAVDGLEVTRKEAVLALANKDGGSHVDPVLSELERKLLKTDLMGWKQVSITGGTETVIREETVGPPEMGGVLRVTGIQGGHVVEEESNLSTPLRALVRQIAHEFHGTLAEQLPALWR